MRDIAIVCTILGARPQFIKAAAVSRALAARPGLREILVHTGQHYDGNMSDVFFSELEIPRPAYNLGIGSGAHGAQTGRMLAGIEEVLLKEEPDLVLIYGDTNSTLAGALAAAKLHIPVAHVEAGLRSFNRRMPEEINRVLADHASDLLFAPTRTALDNLRREGIPDGRIHLVGDVMYDVALFYGDKAARQSGILRKLQLSPQGYILATIHRAENTDDPVRLRSILAGLAAVAQEIPVVLPLHPRTKAAIERMGGWDGNGRIQVIEPLGYLDMVQMERNARLIATDSGGVQKEAFFHHVPCVTLRDETEWVELVELGWNRILPPRSAADIKEGILSALDSKGDAHAAPYGNGDAAQRIAAVIGG